MRFVHFLLTTVSLFCLATTTFAQTPPAEPLPRWDTQVGASFVGTSGNSDTTTAGVDFSLHRRWPVWQIESTGAAVLTTDRGRRTAERYISSFRALRRLTSFVSASSGERVERDRLAGTRLRSILDGGFSWALVQAAGWSVEGITSLAWKHEQSTVGADGDHTVGVFQAASRVSFGENATTTQRFTYYPDFNQASAYRSEAEVTLQAAMNAHLALKFGHLWRFANVPVAGFAKTDNTTTASIVLQWRAPASPRVP
jgi:putative salt-induced outer membrane protein YdiY